MSVCDLPLVIFLIIYLFNGRTISEESELRVGQRLLELENGLNEMRQEHREQLSAIRRELEEKSRQIFRLNTDLETFKKSANKGSQVMDDLHQWTENKSGGDAPRLPINKRRPKRDVSPSNGTGDNPSLLDRLQQSVLNNTHWINELYYRGIKGIYRSLGADVDLMHDRVDDLYSKTLHLNTSILENRRNVTTLALRLDLITEIDCGRPSDHVLNSTLAAVNRTTWRSDATYTCDKGHNYVSGSNQSRCSGNGKWTKPDIFCQLIDCGRPSEHVLNSTLAAVNGTTWRSEAIYTCDKGHKYVSGNNKSRCSGNGKWTKPDIFCQLIDCGRPSDHVLNSTLAAVNGTTWRSEAIYTCDKGHKYVSGNNKSRCSGNGKWTKPDISCQYRGYRFSDRAQLWYRVYSDRGQWRSWTSAAGTCRDEGGTLIYSNSPHRIELVESLAREHGVWPWVGCHKEAGRWLWRDGTEVDGTRWGFDEPNPWDDCCYQRGAKVGGSSCVSAGPFICELLL